MNTDPDAVAETGLPEALQGLWEAQIEQWPMLAEGLAALRSARTRAFQVGASRFEAQCNTTRIRSAAAKVDAASLAARPCFLCEDKRPVEQRALPYHQKWVLLCNPAPIFDPHFTVASIAHAPQRVEPSIRPMLDLADDLGVDFTVFYNGPGSGASAPDHLHLQVTPFGATPFEAELAGILATVDETEKPQGAWIEWMDRDDVAVGTTRGGRRPAVVLMGTDREALAGQIERVIGVLREVAPAEPEPRLNLFATHRDERWIAWLFPRMAHRPSIYGEGPEAYLISPGAIDMGGVLIVPRSEDFERLSADVIQTILDDVLLGPDAFEDVRKRLRQIPG